MFEKYLQEIGLSDKEACVYLALLTFENASVLDLAKKTLIKRPTIYTTLESLAHKGLISETSVGKKTQYYAELPEKLETFIERKMVNLKESQKTLKEMIPQLKSLSRGSGEKPIVKYFEGKEGIFNSNDEILNVLADDSDPMYVIYSRDLIDENFTTEELDRFKKSRLGKHVKSVGIYTYKNGDLGSDIMADRLRIDEKKYPISCDITVYKDIVLLSVLGKRVSAILIKNKDVSETLKSLFKLVYDSKKS